LSLWLLLAVFITSAPDKLSHRLLLNSTFDVKIDSNLVLLLEANLARP
jgi:hypothetical protein